VREVEAGSASFTSCCAAPYSLALSAHTTNASVDGTHFGTGRSFYVDRSGYAVNNIHVLVGTPCPSIDLGFGQTAPPLGVMLTEEDYEMLIGAADAAGKLTELQYMFVMLVFIVATVIGYRFGGRGGDV